MMYTFTQIDMFVDCFLLEIEESALVFWVTANIVLKGFGSNLCYKTKLSMGF